MPWILKALALLPFLLASLLSLQLGWTCLVLLVGLSLVLPLWLYGLEEEGYRGSFKGLRFLSAFVSFKVVAGLKGSIIRLVVMMALAGVLLSSQVGFEPGPEQFSSLIEIRDGDLSFKAAALLALFGSLFIWDRPRGFDWAHGMGLIIAYFAFFSVLSSTVLVTLLGMEVAFYGLIWLSSMWFEEYRVREALVKNYFQRWIVTLPVIWGCFELSQQSGHYGLSWSGMVKNSLWPYGALALGLIGQWGGLPFNLGFADLIEALPAWIGKWWACFRSLSYFWCLSLLLGWQPQGIAPWLAICGMVGFGFYTCLAWSQLNLKRWLSHIVTSWYCLGLLAVAAVISRGGHQHVLLLGGLPLLVFLFDYSVLSLVSCLEKSGIHHPVRQDLTGVFANSTSFGKLWYKILNLGYVSPLSIGLLLLIMPVVLVWPASEPILRGSVVMAGLGYFVALLAIFSVQQQVFTVRSRACIPDQAQLVLTRTTWWQLQVSFGLMIVGVVACWLYLLEWGHFL